MTDAVDDAINREDFWECLRWDHINKRCNPSDCPFCLGIETTIFKNSDNADPHSFL